MLKTFYWPGTAHVAETQWIDFITCKQRIDILSVIWERHRHKSHPIKVYWKDQFYAVLSSFILCGILAFRIIKEMEATDSSCILLQCPHFALLISSTLTWGKLSSLGERSYSFSLPAWFSFFSEKKLSIMLNCTKLCDRLEQNYWLLEAKMGA